MNLVECVFNVSEGRDIARIDRIRGALRSVTGCFLLDVHSDWDHHRSVFTVVGEPEILLDGVLEASRVAVEIIDLEPHRGVHPRIGAVDVVPFVPLAGVTMDACAELAREFGRRIASELDVPVFLYERASIGPVPVSLPEIRRGGLESLFGPSSGIGGPKRIPDFGPDTAHETAGAVAVGAREILIAFNILLTSPEPSIARTIARKLRESSGGLPAVRALGMYLESSRHAQISMNLTDYRRTSPHQAFEAVRSEALLHGTRIRESELVGLAPRNALPPDPESDLLLPRFGPDRILEHRVWQETGMELQL